MCITTTEEEEVGEGRRKRRTVFMQEDEGKKEMGDGCEQWNAGAGTQFFPRPSSVLGRWFSAGGGGGGGFGRRRDLGSLDAKYLFCAFAPKRYLWWGVPSAANHAMVDKKTAPSGWKWIALVLKWEVSVRPQTVQFPLSKNPLANIPFLALLDADADADEDDRPNGWEALQGTGGTEDQQNQSAHA